MPSFPKPILIVSKCLGFEACRWNGLVIENDLVAGLRAVADCRPVCPECAIGLGVPRDPIRIVREEGALHLRQPATGRDVTPEMTRFCQTFLAETGAPDGFLLKAKSPSCGLQDVKVYKNMEKGAPVARAGGFFGQAVRDACPDTPTEDEGRLTNFRIREHFLTAVFTLARFRAARQRGRMRDLVDFHSDHKYLLMACSQAALKALGRIVANPDKRPVDSVWSAYDGALRAALARTPKYTTQINVLEHCLGYFSKKISGGEKKHFLDMVQKFRDGKMPLSVPLQILQGWVVRFDEPYLARQVFFDPYPESLLEITDSGKGRDG